MSFENKEKYEDISEPRKDSQKERIQRKKELKDERKRKKIETIRKRNRHSYKKKRWIYVSAGVGLLLVVLVSSYFIVGAIGKARFNRRAQAEEPVIAESLEQTEELTEEEEQIWHEGWIKYKGKIYTYNEDILTFLFMGIDKNDTTVRRVEEGTNGGQADALFLLVLNPHTKQIQVIGINRNSMTDIDIYDTDGEYVRTVTAQIAVQHGFGDGMEESCEYQVKAVRNLMYQIPIHGYCAINAKAVIPLTDMAGGVELTALEEVKRYGDKNGTVLMQEGDTLHMDGETAYSYVRYRNTKEFGSADRRLDRQKQYLNCMMKQIMDKTKEDILFPVDLYNELSSYMTTDVTVDEITYLTQTALRYQIGEMGVLALEGETVQGEEYEEFYVEEESLQDLIMQVFYEEVTD